MKRLFLLVLCLCVAAPLTAETKMLPIAGDGQDLWLIVPAKDKKQIAIFHRKRMTQ